MAANLRKKDQTYLLACCKVVSLCFSAIILAGKGNNYEL
jgi:hypothetical protein